MCLKSKRGIVWENVLASFCKKAKELFILCFSKRSKYYINILFLAISANKPSNELGKLGTYNVNEINLSDNLTLQIPDLLKSVNIYFCSHSTTCHILNSAITQNCKFLWMPLTPSLLLFPSDSPCRIPILCLYSIQTIHGDWCHYKCKFSTLNTAKHSSRFLIY